jgi:small multidrug resistance pump
MDQGQSIDCPFLFSETPMQPAYIYLFFAILAETIGTVALQASQQFTRIGPSIVVVIGYALSFYLLAITLKTMNLGIVYAIWSGLGIVMIAGIAYLVYGQKLDLPAILGLGMILGGIVIIHLFSSTATH